MEETYYAPGGGLLKLNRDLTDEERMECVDFFTFKGLVVYPEDIIVEDGRTVIKKVFKKRTANE